MNSVTDVLRNKVAEKRLILEGDFSLKKIGVFGSVAKGLASESSDIDILVEFSKPVDLFLFIELKYFLESLFGKTVDLVTARALKPLLRDEILTSAVYLKTSMRNILIHEYFGSDVSIVWNTIQTRLPALRAAVQNIMSKSQ